MGKTEIQELVIDTVSGPRKLLAPAGWEFGKTETKVWSRLLWATVEHREVSENPRSRKKDVAAAQVRAEAFAQVLADAVGMAPFYWLRAAREISATDYLR